jgi:hypothetical protein
MIVGLRTSRGLYLSAEDGGGSRIVCHRHSVREWERFVMVSAPGAEPGRLYLRTCHGQYLSARGGGGGAISADQDKAGPWEIFRRVELGGGRFALQTSSGHFLCAGEAERDWALTADSTEPGDAESFTAVMQPCLFGDVEIFFTDQSERLWTDEGSGISFWKPLAREGYRPVGHACSANPQRVAIVRGGPELVRPPSRYQEIWSDPSSELSVWEPLPPEGFAAAGCVASTRRGQPPALDAIYCVHKNLVRRGLLSGEPLWERSPFSAWRILSGPPTETELQLPPGTFVGTTSRGRPEGHHAAYVLRLKLG